MGYDPFYLPMTLAQNPPTPNLVFYLYDHLGNTRLTYSTTTDCTGDFIFSYTIEAVMDYYPYGKILREYSNGEQEKYLTTQHERDVETGLDYRGARFYDGDLGRFLSLDPLAADFAEWSAYNYVLGNPVMFIDPDGRFPILPGLVGGAIGFGVGFVIGATTKEGSFKEKMRSGFKGGIGGAVGGFIVASGAALVAGAGFEGITGTTLAYNSFFGGIAGGASSLATQGTEILMGERTKISSFEVATDIVIGIPANILGGIASSKVKEGLRGYYGNKVSKGALKELTKEVNSQLKKDPTLTGKVRKEIKKIVANEVMKDREAKLELLKFRVQTSSSVIISATKKSVTGEVDSIIKEKEKGENE